MLVTFTTSSKVKACTPGLMAVDTKVNGRTTKCMDKVSSHGLMAGDSKAHITMTRSMVMASSRGLMVGCLKVCGGMASMMELGNTSVHEVRLNMENGRMECI